MREFIIRQLSKKNIVRVLLLICLFLFLFPILWLFLLSLKTPLQAFNDPPLWIFTPTLENYKELISDDYFFRCFFNSIIVSLGTVALSLFVAVPASYVFSRAKFPFQKGILNLILITRMAPGMAFVIPFVIAYSSLKIIGSRYGLIIAYLTFNLSLVVWLMTAYFDEIPVELEEAAHIDGASVFQTFLKVTVPLVAPGLIATAVLCFITSWNEFMFALLLTDRDTRTAPVAILRFMGYEGLDWGKLATASMFVILPVVVFAFVTQKYFVKGLLGGAMKE
jgi:multiple sugar transport system permease protein